MKVRRLSRRPPAESADPDLAKTLETMSAPELRAFVHAVLDDSEDEERTRLVDSLMARAARGR